MTDKHTPGPWIISTPTKGYEVCTMHGLPPQPTEDGCGQTWVYIGPETLFREDKWHWPDEAEQLANARLIAAAPDLLAALDDMLNGENWRAGRKFDPNSGNFDLSTQRAAIAKARGQV